MCVKTEMMYAYQIDCRLNPGFKRLRSFFLVVFTVQNVKHLRGYAIGVIMKRGAQFYPSLRSLVIEVCCVIPFLVMVMSSERHVSKPLLRSATGKSN